MQLKDNFKQWMRLLLLFVNSLAKVYLSFILSLIDLYVSDKEALKAGQKFVVKAVESQSFT